MIFRSILLAGAAALLGIAPALAQGSITENVNNTGIPRNAPALGLPNIYGLNPCSSGAAVGVTTPLFGIGGAISNIDRECETRNNAAVVVTGLKDETLAREILCTIKDIREAAARVGKPCLQDQPAVRVSAAAPAAYAPVIAAPVTAAQAPAAPPTVARGAASVPPNSAAQPQAPDAAIKPVAAAVVIPAGAPAFCRVNGLDLTLYPECRTAQAPVVPPVAAVKRPSFGANQAVPPAAHRRAVPAAPEQPAPTVSLDGPQQTIPSWVEAISYVPGHVSGGKPVLIAVHAATSSPAAATSSPAAVASPPGRMAQLLERGADLIAAGDITAARLIYEHAAAAGSGEAAIEMGKTYDPVFLLRIKAIGTQPDQVTAETWYRRAVALGDAKAKNLLQGASQ
jgi:hypothetical protein